MRSSTRSRKFLTTRHMIIFPILGVIMFISKILMEGLPNIHLLGMLTMTYTLVYRSKALIPIYIYVLLNGLFSGFDMWWIPYLYIWTILWGLTMLLPKRMPTWLRYVIYPLLCCIHGLLYGALYAPAQALMFNFTPEQTAAWIIAGFPFDIIHGIGNLALGFLIPPMAELLRKLEEKHS